jgi:hypothetical protein
MKSNSRAKSASPSQRGGQDSFKNTFSRGVYVKVIHTENVSQRVPTYIGEVGTIEEVPVHPSTWYKVRFENEIVTFRSSALQIVEHEVLDESNGAGGTNSGSKRSRQKEEKEKENGKVQTEEASRRSSKSAAVTTPVLPQPATRERNREKEVNKEVKESPSSAHTKDSRSIPAAIASPTDEQQVAAVSSDAGSVSSEPVYLHSLDPDGWVGRGVRVALAEGRVWRA